MLKHIMSLMLVVMLMMTMSWAQEEAVSDSVPQAVPISPPTNVRAFDTPYDNGHSITLEWDLSADDPDGKGRVLSYRILRSDMPDGPFVDRGVAIPAGEHKHNDKGVKESDNENYFPKGKDFYYKVVAVSADGESESAIVGPVHSAGQFFNRGLSAVAIACLIFTVLTIYFIRKARRGAELYIRPLAGIDAVDEAIGRATEMGKPILYIMGLGTAADIATIASFTILGRVAKKVAEYQTSLIVPCYDPIVMTVAQETVKTGYYDAGRPDAYNEDDVFFLTNQQFAYVSGVNGIMVRQKPATNFYLGKFYAESLIMAETGNSINSIQIAGTDEVTQIPFFVVACDYTLIGEELYAASAYLGREPVLLGTLKAQDWAKACVLICIILGVLGAIAHQTWFTDLFKVIVSE
ncbi:MAG: fibronectin type III domain-containing protein [Candidatus Zixiibacteriota bacterium]